jgi:tRNA-specific 2-thiouridylase
LEREFVAGVVDHFVQEYARGRTPNPCLACNSRVKFRSLLERALALGADRLATGHHVRVRRNGRGYEIWRAVDKSKDQSYVLYALGQRELSRSLFPVGEHTKDEVRAIARSRRLPNADKADSADICFIPSGDYRAFVRQRVSSQPGDILDTAGNRLGRHRGIVDYTVGQRRALPARGNGRPLYVLSLEPKVNAVVVGPEEELLAPGLIAEDLSFVSGEIPQKAFQTQARIRYASQDAPATVEAHGDSAEVRFHHRQRAVAPGQAVVFYEGERVIGGGTITAPLAG